MDAARNEWLTQMHGVLRPSDRSVAMAAFDAGFAAHRLTPAPDKLDAATIERCAAIADELWGDGPSGSYDNGATADGWNMATNEIAKQIRALATDPHQHGGKEV